MLPQARRVAFKVLGDSTAAEDAAAEAFARALASWRRVGALPHRDAWILRVTTNVAVDMARKRERGRRAAEQLAPTVPSVVDGGPPLTRMALVTALDGLPRRQREVVTLRYLADLSDDDVASCLGVSVGTVHRHAHRGLEALRARFDSPDLEETHHVAI